MEQKQENLIIANNSSEETLASIKEYYELRAQKGYTRRIKIHREQKHLIEMFTIPKENIILYGKKRNYDVSNIAGKDYTAVKEVFDQIEMQNTALVAEELFKKLIICKDECSLLTPKKTNAEHYQVIIDNSIEPANDGIYKDYWNTHSLEKDQIIEDPVIIEDRKPKKENIIMKFFKKFF